jgi:hypothetical protein
VLTDIVFDAVLNDVGKGLFDFNFRKSLTKARNFSSLGNVKEKNQVVVENKLGLILMIVISSE